MTNKEVVVGSGAAFGRLRREDRTASTERHVNKPLLVSKYGGGNRSDVSMHRKNPPPPQKKVIYYGKRKQRCNFKRPTTI